jgi:lipopolysaccharide/colanic/teichoic acid biosynthesis glycosyltransferase
VKRAFDLIVTVLASVVWAPVLVLSCLAILVLEGRPLLYVSKRRVYAKRSTRVFKFRTMRRDADRIANRSTVPFEGTRFLNIHPDSPLYTRVGRILERCCFTELPQLVHVLAGEMSLVGNRPLPEDVVAALKEAFPDAEERFLTPAGLTGPVQLVGRESLRDDERLRIEIAYCRLAAGAYSMRLDFLILLYTVLMGARLSNHFSVAEVEDLLARFQGARRFAQRGAPLSAAHCTDDRTLGPGSP